MGRTHVEVSASDASGKSRREMGIDGEDFQARAVRGNRLSLSVESSRIVGIEDLRRLARCRLPKVVFDYLDGGAEGEFTLRENCRAYEEVTFKPRHAVAVPTCDPSTQLLGFNL